MCESGRTFGRRCPAVTAYRNTDIDPAVQKPPRLSIKGSLGNPPLLQEEHVPLIRALGVILEPVSQEEHDINVG